MNKSIVSNLVLLLLMSTCLSATPDQRKCAELTAYASMNTFAENSQANAAFEAGWNFSEYINSTIAVDAHYRNYSILTKEYLTISGCKRFDIFEARIGLTGGVYSLSIGNYSSLIPQLGAEVSVIFHLSPDLSIRLKERVLEHFENGNTVLTTGFYTGFCYSFIDRKNVGKKD